MSSESPTQKPPRKRLKRLTAHILGIAAIWFAVILWWQVSERPASINDILIYLVALPILLVFSIGLLIKINTLKKRDKPRDVQSAQGNASIRDLAPPPPAATLPLIGVWAATSIGGNVIDYAEALASRKHRPTPDTKLTNEEGFPVLSSRTNDLDTASLQQFLAQITTEGSLEQDFDDTSERTAHLRALALLEAVFEQLQADWPFVLDGEYGSDATAISALHLLKGAGGVAPARATPLKLDVKLLVPAGFSSNEQQLARVLASTRLDHLPLHAQAISLDLCAAEDDATALHLTRQFLHDLQKTDEARSLLILACDSAICPAVIEEWDAEQRLFAPGRPQGLMPGEAAFAVLFANDKAIEFASSGVLCRLSGISTERRNISANQAGRPSHACLDQAIASALQSADVPAERIGTVVCDADHRTSRTLECIGAMMAHTPQLDAIQSRLATNEACGHLGVASVSGMLVFAAFEASRHDKPVLIFNVSHPHERAAAILLPETASQSTNEFNAA